MAYLLSVDGGKLFSRVLSSVKVFARVAPKQKVRGSVGGEGMEKTEAERLCGEITNSILAGRRLW